MVRKKLETDIHTHLARGLCGVLADTYRLYNATQACHWNVEGPRFAALHEMFERQYTEMASAIDVIAERVRALGFYTPGTLDELMSRSRVASAPGLRRPEQMLDHLIEGHRLVTHRLTEVQSVAEEAMDQATLDLLIERLRVHEKAIWMLRAQAGDESAILSEDPRASSVS